MPATREPASENYTQSGLWPAAFWRKAGQARRREVATGLSRLRKQEVGNAAGIYNLVRNIGGSIGIASATAFLVRMGQVHQNYLGANLSPSDSFLGKAICGLSG